MQVLGRVANRQVRRHQVRLGGPGACERVAIPSISQGFRPDLRLVVGVGLGCPPGSGADDVGAGEFVVEGLFVLVGDHQQATNEPDEVRDE